MKQLLAAQEKDHPRLFDSLLAAMRPLMGSVPG
jgi:tRNA 2-thiocytidine biosynthesis protein TtcA